MKKLLVALCLTCVLTLAAQAADTNAVSGKAKKPAMTAEQKALMKEMTAKYDLNKDGKLDKEERSKISADDKAKMEAAGLMKSKKPAGDQPAADKPAGETK